MILTNSRERKDYEIIAEIIPQGSKVLDLGCGDGSLLKLLEEEKQIKGQGVELSFEGIKKCIEQGLTVFQGNLDEGLQGFSNNSFDFVLLNYTLKYLKRPRFLLTEMLKIGNKCIIGMQNSAQLINRIKFLLKGRIGSSILENYDDGNLSSFLNINQFIAFCKENRIKILKSWYLSKRGQISVIMKPNLTAEFAIFLIQN